MRSGYKCEIHAVLAKCGVQVLMSDLFGDEGTACWNACERPRRTWPGSGHCVG